MTSLRQKKAKSDRMKMLPTMNASEKSIGWHTTHHLSTGWYHLLSGSMFLRIDTMASMNMALTVVPASMTLLASELQGLMSLTCLRLQPMSTSPTTEADMMHPPHMLSMNETLFTRSAMTTNVIDSAMPRMAMSAPNAPHAAMLAKFVWRPLSNSTTMRAS